MCAAFQPTWTVHEHVIPASHPRGYRRGVRNPQTSRLRLHVKQYVPVRERALPETAITLIVQHGMPPGDNKEVYEPFLWDLISHPNTPPIRAIWAADIASSAQSYLLNKDEIGDDPHWFDTARDMMQMVNYFQDDMKPPLVGYGQSWGCNALIMCASWNSRIFQSVILSEPVVENGWFHQNDPRRLRGEVLPDLVGMGAGPRLARRRSKWLSREEARKYFTRSPQFREFDPRVLEQILKYEVVELNDGSVQYATPSRQLVPMFLHPSPALPGFPEHEEYASRTPDSDNGPGFYNAMGARVKEALAGVHCKVLYMWATDESFISDQPYRERVVKATGTGVGGGGGKAKGQVREVFVEGGHFLPLMKPKKCAEAAAEWLGSEFWPWWLDQEDQRKKEAPIDPVNFPPGFTERLERIIKPKI